MDREEIARLLNYHHRTRGMAVTMGTTCACGYWSGSEKFGHEYTVPGLQGADLLDLHRATVIAKALAAESAAEAVTGSAAEAPDGDRVERSERGGTGAAEVPGTAEKRQVDNPTRTERGWS